MSRDTSFYYSFLVLPSAKRQAIVAVWDFCRAVDDAVDEVAPDSHRGSPLSDEARALATKSLAGWRTEVKEVFEGTRRHGSRSGAAAVRQRSSTCRGSSSRR